MHLSAAYVGVLKVNILPETAMMLLLVSAPSHLSNYVLESGSMQPNVKCLRGIQLVDQ